MLDNDFIAYILEQLEPLGVVTARKMFGGYGIFTQGVMFALVADDLLYMKVDKGNIQVYQEAGQSPFTYMKGAKPVAMSYYGAPDEALEDRELLLDLAHQSVAAAKRTKRER